MRYDKLITLTDKKEKYDAGLGEYVTEKIIYKTLYANISYVSLERTKELFGQVESGIMIARIQGDVLINGNTIEIEDEEYNILKKTQTRRDTAFYIRKVV